MLLIKCNLCGVQYHAERRSSVCPHDSISKTTQRDSLLQEREKTHGSFAQNAAISQSLKLLFKQHSGEERSAIHREALDMIALKLSRILSGQSNFKDNWDDIAGYAKLGSEACK